MSTEPREHRIVSPCIRFKDLLGRAVDSVRHVDAATLYIVMDGLWVRAPARAILQ